MCIRDSPCHEAVYTICASPFCQRSAYPRTRGIPRPACSCSTSLVSLYPVFPAASLWIYILCVKPVCGGLFSSGCPTIRRATAGRRLQFPAHGRSATIPSIFLPVSYTHLVAVTASVISVWPLSGCCSTFEMTGATLSTSAVLLAVLEMRLTLSMARGDRKSTRLNSSH